MSQDGIWWALVRVEADPNATASEVEQSLGYDVKFDINTEDGAGIIQSVVMYNNLTPDNGGLDDPVVYFP